MSAVNAKKMKYLTFLLPILIFFLFSSFSDLDYFREKDILKLVIGFTSYSIAFYISYDFFLAKLKQDSHFLSHAIIYAPLCIFLMAGSYALYKGSVGFLNDERILYNNGAISEARELAANYIENCQKKFPNEMHEQCIGRYLIDNLSSDIANIKARHDDLSNGYSVIAIITGFFGVLMTVLVIYFSISSKEEFVRRVTEAEKKIQDSSNSLKDEFDKKIKEANDNAEASDILLNELVCKIKNFTDDLDSLKVLREQVTQNKGEIDKFKKSIGDKVSKIQATIDKFDKKPIHDSPSKSNNFISDEDNYFQITPEGTLCITIAKNITLEASQYNVCIIDTNTRKPLDDIVDKGVMSGADRIAELSVKDNGLGYFRNVESLLVKLTNDVSINKGQVNADAISELFIPLVKKGKA